jgi:glycerol-3-phosphate dehydrogenase
MYDLTGGLRIGRRHRRVSADEALAHIPTLDRSQLARGYVYFDAQADDARLTLAIARTAAAHGAVVANHAGVTAFEKHDGTVVGAHVSADGEDLTVRARALVNASGVWADDVRALDEGAHPASMQPAKGVHITLPWSMVRNQIAAIVPAPDGERMVFVIPWGDHTYVGTTDTTYDGPLDDPRCTPDDVQYLLDALNGVTDVGATAGDVVGTWAGLRPLLRVARHARTADLSRRHAVRVGASGMVTVTGGKLTTYRRMAADAVDTALRSLPGEHAPSATRRLRLVGADGVEPPRAALPLAGGTVRTPSTTEHLASRYGSEASAVAALAHEQPAWKDPLVPGLPYLKAEAVFAVREEMARTLDDVLSRRTRARILDRRASVDAAPAVAELLAGELGWSTSERDAEVTRYRDLAEADRC